MNADIDVPVLCQVNLVVRSVAASVAFYRALGLVVEEAAAPEWANHHAAVVMPIGVRLELDSRAFARAWDPGLRASAGGSACVLFFGVGSREAVDEMVARMAAGGTAVQKAPEDAFWGARYAILEDPDGHAVGVMSPVEPSRTFAPPEPPDAPG